LSIPEATARDRPFVERSYRTSIPEISLLIGLDRIPTGGLAPSLHSVGHGFESVIWSAIPNWGIAWSDHRLHSRCSNRAGAAGRPGCAIRPSRLIESRLRLAPRLEAVIRSSMKGRGVSRGQVQGARVVGWPQPGAHRRAVAIRATHQLACPACRRSSLRIRARVIPNCTVSRLGAD
jgi:hypothetical protein